MNLVTGYRGYPHVTSNDQAALHKAIFGAGHCVINTGNVFKATFTDTDVIRIADGDAIIQGRHARIDPGMYEDVELTAGTTGNNRLDYIAIRYTKSTTGVEDASIVQICGVPTTGTAVAPSLTQQDTSEFGSTYELPLYSIAFTGLSIGIPTAVFTAVADIQSQIDALEKNKQNTLTGGASTVASSNLTASRALVSNSSGKISVSAVTATELSYLTGLTSNAQTQLNNIKTVLNGLGRFYFKAAAANLASAWSWTLKKFDTSAELTASYGNLTSKVTNGYWIPPATGFFFAQFIVSFASNSKGSRGACMALFDSSNAVAATLATAQVGAINHAQSITVTAAGVIPSDRKLGLRIAQDSGSTLSVSATARVLWIPNL